MLAPLLVLTGNFNAFPLVAFLLPVELKVANCTNSGTSDSVGFNFPSTTITYGDLIFPREILTSLFPVYTGWYLAVTFFKSAFLTEKPRFK